MGPSELDRLKRLEEAFHNALERAEGQERNLFVAAIAATDPENGTELRQLLASDSRIAAVSPGHPASLPRFGSWQTMKVLGRGGMGTVYLAERADGAFEMQAAVKVVPLALASSELEERFVRERRILAMLNHPRIARLLDGGISENGIPYLVMEFVNGEHIDSYAAKHSLDRLARIRLILQVLTALEYVHGERVLHRDLKPSNVLIDTAGRVKLVDFGIARLMEPGAADSFTRSGIFTFTPDYASPEQSRGETLSPASDIYSVGVLLAKVITGKLPGDTDLPRSVGARLAAVISKATRKDPAARYASAAEMAADLKRIVDGKTPAALQRRRTLLLSSVALSTLLLATFLAFVLHGHHDEEILGPTDAASPTVSADAKWLVWVHNGRIWLSPAGSETRRQITFLPGHDARPSLSADGTFLVYEHYFPNAANPILYRANLRNGVLASAETSLWPGYRPHLSPDSQKLAFETLNFSGADDAVPREIQVSTLNSPAGAHFRVGLPKKLSDWIWKTDSSGLLALGHRSVFNATGLNRLEFYSLDLHHTDPQPIEYWPAEYGELSLCGMSAGKHLVALATLGADRQWLEFSPSLASFRVIRTGLDASLGCQLVRGDRLVLFADRSNHIAWRLSGDIAAARYSSNAPVPTRFKVQDSLSASLDGRWLAWWDGEKGLLRSPSGDVRTLSSTLQPILSRDGGRLIYLDSTIQAHFHLLSLPNLKELRSFEVDSILWDVSHNADRVLAIGTPFTPRSIAIMDTNTRLMQTILADPTRDLYLASFSPDEHWILFTAESIAARPTLYVAPLESSHIIPRSEWIELGRGDYPKWGASNDRIYFISPTGALTTMSLNPRTKAPLPSSARVVFTPNGPWQISTLQPGTFRITVTQDALYFPLGKRELSAELLHR